MGPRSRERGKFCTRWMSVGSPSALQWGRAHVSAESVHGASLGPGCRAASMGPRSRERGKYEEVVAVRDSLLDASMGPRSRERGKKFRKMDEGAQPSALLQWGRAHVSAESSAL